MDYQVPNVSDLRASVQIGPKQESDKHHQVFNVVFSSLSAQLRWEVNPKFDRFRRLNTIITATSTATATATAASVPARKPGVFTNLEFPEHHHTGPGTRMRWLSRLVIDKEKVQEDRRKQLEIWLNNILANVAILPPAVKGDLADLMRPQTTSATSSTSTSSTFSSSSSSSSSSSISTSSADPNFSGRSGASVYSPRSSVLGGGGGGGGNNLQNTSGATLSPKSDVLTDIFMHVSKYFSERIYPDHARIQTLVTCVSRSGNVISASISSILGDFCCAVCEQLVDLLPCILPVVAVAALLCNGNSTAHDSTCAGFPMRRPIDFQLFFASVAGFVFLRWRARFRKVLATQQSLNNRQGLNSLQSNLQQFCNDPSIVYSLDPTVLRRRFGSGTGSEGDSLSPRKTAKSRSASVVSRDMSAATFDKFDFEDVSAEAKTHYWDTGSSHHFQLRGLTYMDDNNKEHPGPALCKLMLMELYEVEPQDGDRHDHVCSKGLARKRIEAISSLPGKPFIYAINFQIPGDPPVSMVAYFALSPNVLDRFPGGATEKFLRVFEKFTNVGTDEERLASWKAEGVDITPPRSDNKETSSSGSSGSSWLKVPADIQWPSPHEPGAFPQSDFRNQRFKLIANITDGPWVVKAAVPAKPALLGKKVVARYFGGDNYMETDVHVGSSLMAAQITSLCRGFVKQFGADLAIVIQGEDESELPEKVVGCLHIHKINLDLRRKLYEEDEEEGIE